MKTTKQKTGLTQAALPQILIILLALALVLSACSPNESNSTPTDSASATEVQANAPTNDSNAIATSVAQTVEAELTQVAAANPTNTLAPTATDSPLPTEAPTEPQATDVGTVPPSESTLANHARFIEDVTIPDGTLVIAGDAFTKTWRLQNIGSEPWTADYSFVFINGDRMEGQAVTLTQEIPPGGIIDISIPMIAPLETGTYTGYWMFQAPDTEEGDDGPIFGIGVNASQAMYVQVNVILPTPEPTTTQTPTSTTEGATSEAATPTPTPGPSVVNVSLGVDGNAFFGTCPGTLSFNAVVTLTGPLTFDYRVNAIPSDSNFTFTDVPADTIESTQTGLHTVEIPFTLTITESVTGQIGFEITSPSTLTSPPIAFAVTCQ